MPRRPNIIQEKTNQMTLENIKMNGLEKRPDKQAGGEENGEDDTNKMAAETNSLKSSRRKQSKPIRVPLFEVDNTKESVPPVTTEQTNDKIEKTKSDSPEENNPVPMDVDTVFSCDKCSETFTQQSSLRAHLATVHDSEKFLTPYHRLGNELQQGMVFHGEAETATSSGGDENQTPTSEETTQERVQPLDMTSQKEEGVELGEVTDKSESRIFHPEAYCSICNREFCNKYFLKTHKANKHGIYENSPGFQPTNGAAFPAFSSATPTPPSDQISNSGIGSGQNVQAPQSQRQAATPPVTTTSNAEPVPSRSVQPDLEDYCEFCQKHFCNKYYLKKHKLDVHGIKQESPSSNSKPNPPPVSDQQNGMPPATSAVATMAPLMLPQNAMGNIMLISPFMTPMGLIPGAGLLPQQIAQASQPMPMPVFTQPMTQQSSTVTTAESTAPTATSQPTTSSSSFPMPNDALRSIGVLNADAYCEICRKEFCNKYFLKIHKANKHGIFSSEDIANAAGGKQMRNNISMPIPMPMPPLPMGVLPPGGFPFLPIKTEPENTPTTISALQMQIESQIKKEQSPVPPASQDGALNLSSSSPKVETPTSSSGDNPMSTMFSNMVMSKMADRVMCDLCNKEVCNKYFLKLHRMKIHGIDPPDGMRLDGLPHYSTPPPPPLPPKPPTPTETVENTTPGPSQSHDELMRMGIDPEAYCEICKKEFCSKYFLRTHKLNIHGIRVVKPTEQKSTPVKTSSSPVNLKPVQVSPFKIKSETSDIPEQISWRWKESPSSVNPRVMCDICNKELCNKYFLRTHKLNKHGITDDSPLSLTPKSSPGFPVMKMDFSPTKPENLSNSTSSIPEQFANYRQSEQSDATDLSKSATGPSEAIKQHTNNNNKTSSVTDSQSEDDDPAKRYFNHFTEVCRLCDRRFKSAKWLHNHLVTDHGLNDEKVLSSISGEDAQKEMNMADKISSRPNREVCQLCGMVCISTLALDLHIIQEHPAPAPVTGKPPEVAATETKMVDSQLPVLPQVAKEVVPYTMSASTSIGLSLKRKYQKSARYKLYTCSHCDYKTRWLSNIYSHEERKHNSTKEFKKHTCNECLRCFRYEHSLIRHMEQYHRTGVSGQKSENGNGERVGGSNQIRGKKFRCAHCKDCFQSKQLCFAHIRTVHGRNQSANNNQKSVPKMKIFSCSLCDYKTKYQSNLHSHRIVKHKLRGSLKHMNSGSLVPDANNAVTNEHEEPVTYATPSSQGIQPPFLMQPFKVQEVGMKDVNFINATVYLPVHTKVTETTTVTFSLTPTEQ